jgi:hypothetical protein
MDTSFGQAGGGRWNRPESFGVLHLNQSVEVAAAQVRHMFRSGEATVFDLRPERRPQLLEVEVPDREVVDAVSDEGIAELGLPLTYPYAVDHATCQPIGQRAYEAAGIAGIACRSAAECSGPAEWVGEELALFDREVPATREGVRRPFTEWYPQPER